MKTVQLTRQEIYSILSEGFPSIKVADLKDIELTEEGILRVFAPDANRPHYLRTNHFVDASFYAELYDFEASKDERYEIAEITTTGT